MILYIAKIVDYNELNQYITDPKVDNKNGKYMLIYDKRVIIPKAFERLGSLLNKIGYNYYFDYDSVEIYENYINRNVGDIIGEVDSLEKPIPELKKIYHSDVSIGDYFNGMIVIFNKPKNIDKQGE